MIRKLAVLIAVLPLTALAQGAGPGSRAPGHGPGRGQGPGHEEAGPGSDERLERMEKRARLARNLGLAEALDLDTAQATRLADALAKVDDRRVALHKQLRDARQLLRRAAGGEKVTAAEVDGALAKVLDLRAQGAALDKELLTTVTKDLSPEKKARAALFLGRFEQRMGGAMGPPPGMEGRHGPGMHGGQGPGMGRGGMGRGPCDCPDCVQEKRHE